MKSREVEFALRKQLLQIEIAEQRGHAVAVLERGERLFGPVQRMQHWADVLRQQPQWLALLAVAVIAYRPQLAWRWARRAWRGWRWWRGLRGGLDALLNRILAQL